MSIKLDIPGRGIIELQHGVFDINGTLAVDGKPILGTVGCLKHLAAFLSIRLLTAGTHGNIAELEQAFKFPLRLISTGEEKTRFVEQLGSDKVIAFGNGANDAGMLRLAAVGIAILTTEGLSTSALQAADVLALGPIDAINLALNPKRLVATLRG